MLQREPRVNKAPNSLTFYVAYILDGLKSRGMSFLVSFLNNVVENWQEENLEIWAMNDGVNSATVTISAPRYYYN